MPPVSAPYRSRLFRRRSREQYRVSRIGSSRSGAKIRKNPFHLLTGRTRMRSSILITSLVVVSLGIASTAEANKTRLDIVWGGTQGTVVFIHGKGNCTESSLGSFDSRCGNDAHGYWLNSTSDGGDGHDFMDEATVRVNANGTLTTWEAIAIRYDGENQGFWSAANDVAACLKDLAAGSNASGCNPSLVHRTSFGIVVHSEGGAIIDRILSTGWFPELTGPNGAITGFPVTSAGAL